MVIQGIGSSASLYGTLAKSGIQRQELPPSNRAVEKSTDSVTISEAAKALAAAGSRDANQATQQRSNEF
jgi:hypothetical protein